MFDNDDDDNEASILPKAKKMLIPSSTTTDCTSTNRSKELQHLPEVFLDKTSSELEASLIQNGSYSETVNSLLGQNSMSLFYYMTIQMIMIRMLQLLLMMTMMMNYYIVFFWINRQANAFHLS